MMIGALSSSPTMFSRCSTTAGMVKASIGEGILVERLYLDLEALGAGEHAVALAS